MLSLLAAGAAVVAVNPAGAAAPTTCDTSGSVATLSDLSVTGGTVVGVCGFFDKNVVGNSDYISFALGQLGLASYDGTPIATVSSGYGASGQDFIQALGGPLYGDIYVAFHTGNGADWGNNTAFFHIVADAGGVTSIVPNTGGKGLSNAALFAVGAPGARTLSSSVPEPATWAMMLMGFGLVGAGLRGRRRTGPCVLA